MLSSGEQTELALRARYDQDAFSSLVNEVTSLVWSIIHKRMSSFLIEDKEDMYQTIMLHLCRKIDKFDGKSQFSTWLWRLANNKIVNHYRRYSLEQDHRRAEVEKATAVKDYSVNLIYADVTSGLPDKYKEVMWKVYVEGMTYQQISHEEGIKYETVRWRVGRAIKVAREILERKGALK